MTRLIDSLPQPEKEFLNNNKTTILDWGCAMGEGVRALAEAFPLSSAAGIDIAASAIHAARERYPSQEFIPTVDGKIPRQFDVIVTSNVLEHLMLPYEIMKEQIASCRLLYLVLVPLKEYPLMEGHLTTFTEAWFPRYMSSFVRLFARDVAMDPEFWYGNQILAGYASREYLRLRENYASSDVDERLRLYFDASRQRQSSLDTMSMILARTKSGSWVLGARAMNGLRRSLVPYGSRRAQFLHQLNLSRRNRRSA